MTSTGVSDLSGSRPEASEFGSRDARAESMQRYPLLVFAVVIFFLGLLEMPIDDGLRHVGLASEGGRQWASVYPHSRFQDYPAVEPWFGYDLALRGLHAAIALVSPSALLSRFLLLKGLMLFFGMITCLYLIRKSGVAQAVQGPASLALFVALTLLFLSQPIYRAMMARPFIFGTLYLVYSIGGRGAARGAASSALLTFFYPYLSWFYILPAAVCHLLRGSRKFALGALGFLALFLLFQPLDFWGLLKALAEAGTVRREIDQSITELAFSLGHFFCLFYLGLIAAAFPFFSPGARRLTCPALLLLAYLPPSLLYIRTFLDVFMPLAFVVYGRELFAVLGGWSGQVAAGWRAHLHAAAPERLRRWQARRRGSGMRSRSGSLPLRAALAAGFALLIVLAGSIAHRHYRELKAVEAALSVIPRGATVLTSFNQQYRVLFLRPDLSVIPSSEIGFPSPRIREEYAAFFRRGAFRRLAEKTGAGFLIEANDMRLDPQDASRLLFAAGFSGLNVWAIQP